MYLNLVTVLLWSTIVGHSTYGSTKASNKRRYSAY